MRPESLPAMLDSLLRQIAKSTLFSLLSGDHESTVSSQTSDVASRHAFLSKLLCEFADCRALYAHYWLHDLFSMNQYDVDEYVLPRRRSPWVLVGE